MAQPGRAGERDRARTGTAADIDSTLALPYRVPLGVA
jgi:hypothetical protein